MNDQRRKAKPEAEMPLSQQATEELARTLNALWEEQEIRAEEREMAAQVFQEVWEELVADLSSKAQKAFPRKLAARRRQQQRERQRAQRRKPKEEVERFSLLFRVQHIMLFSSCIILILTGLPLKFPNSTWAGWYFRLTGGVQVSGAIHRVGAVGLIGVGLFHLFYITCLPEGRREFRQLFPRLKDFQDVLRNVLYFFGWAKEGARFGRFSYIEKFDYWAVYWGMVIMIGSGLIMWAEELAMQFLPKFALDIAHEAHSDEALLATLAIIIWHFYNVHLNPDHFPMSWTWWTGKISLEEMRRKHPLEYEEMLRERAQREAADE